MQVVAISYDSVAKLKKFQKKGSITFPLLSDAESKVIDAYGLRNKQSKAGIPHPGTIIIDTKGVIRAKLFNDGYRKRHTSEDLIKAHQQLK